MAIKVKQKCPYCPKQAKKCGYYVACRVCTRCCRSCGCRGIPKAVTDEFIAKWETRSAIAVSTVTGKLIPQRIINELHRPLGLEVEIAEFGNLARYAPKYFGYHITRDGSVKPSEQEMVLDPLSGDKFIAAMVEISREMFRNNCEMNGTCGMHVHVNGKDMSYWNIRQLLRLYISLEPMIYRVLCAPSRSKNRYCGMLDEPFHKALETMQSTSTPSANLIKDALGKALYGSNTNRNRVKLTELFRDKLNKKNFTHSKETRDNEYQRAFRQDLAIKAQKYAGDEGARGHVCRYFGLNLHSWCHRGTVEFRMKEGTLDVNEMIHWPLFCGYLVELAVNLSDARINKMPYIHLVPFAREFMPRYISAWVEDRAEKFLSTLSGQGLKTASTLLY